jgi:hypothetical protein
LTYDNLLGIFNKQNEFVKRVHLKQAKIIKIQPGHVVFLEEVQKGFFSDGKEEYQIKF